MNRLREHWELITAGAAMLGLLLFGGIFIAEELGAQGGVQRPVVAARGPASAAAARTPAPAVSAAATPAAATPAAPTPAPTAAGHGQATAPSPAGAPTNAPAGGSAPPPAVTYPSPAAGSAAFTTKFLTSDLSLPQAFTEQFSESSRGAATLHAFYAVSSSGFPALRGCLQASSQPACTPGRLPYDSTGHVHWPVGSGSYLLRLASYSSSQLIGFSLWWTGPHSDAIAGLRIPKACSTYSAGCGLRFEFTTSGGGTCTVNASTPLHLRVQQKDSTAPAIYSHSTPASFAVPSAATWTGQLLSTTSSASSVSMSISWP